MPTYSDDGQWWWAPQPRTAAGRNGNPAVKRDEIQVLNYSYPTALPKPAPNTLALTLPEGWKMQ